MSVHFSDLKVYILKLSVVGFRTPGIILVQKLGCIRRVLIVVLFTIKFFVLLISYECCSNYKCIKDINFISRPALRINYCFMKSR